MATITSTPTAGSLTVNGNTRVNGTISWNKPSVPSNATISSCVLTGTATASMTKNSATITVNGQTVTSGRNFTINLGTSNSTTSVTTTAKGSNKNARGTVSFSNLVYTVTYTVTTYYTVTFKDWDGTILKTESVAEGGSATAPSNPTRTGYKFSGWDKTFSNITGDLIVTAQYIKQYTVTFVDYNGTTLKTQTVDEGGSATAPSNPSRTGYTFSGWDKAYTNITSDLTITAQYTINTYTVTFKDWDNTTLKTETINHGSSAVAPNDPSREGYTFTGWDKGFSNITTNLTVTAQYTINVYTVTFVDYDGRVIATQNINHGSSASAPANPTRDGYRFTGWAPDFSNITSNITITAQYVEIAYYTVTFTDWDGSILKTQTIEAGYAATAPSNPSRNGYIFIGWDVDFSNIVSHLTVTAVYEIIISITNITLDIQNIELAMGATETITAIISPTNSNEELVWSVDNDNVRLDIVIPSNDPASAQITTREKTIFITGLKMGDSVLTCSNPAGTIMATCNIQIAGINSFPPFTNGQWNLYTEATETLLADYSYGFTTESTNGYIGIHIPIPDEWYGKIIKLKLGSISEGATLNIQSSTTYEEILSLNPSKMEGTIDIPPNDQYTIFFRTDYLASGEKIVTNVAACVIGEITFVETLKLNTNEIEVKNGANSFINCLITPIDAHCDLVWSSDNSNVILGYSGLTCNVFGLEIGTSVVTVTDRISGLSDSCTVTIIENVDENRNIFPPFNIPGTWYLDGNCTLVSSSAYDYSFNAPGTWQAVSISIPDEWYGKVVELSCESMSENAALYMQETTNWSEIGVLRPNGKIVQANIPDKGTYADIKLILQAPSTPGLISITGAYARFADLDEEEDNDIQDGENSYVYLEYDNRIVGYKKPDVEPIVEDAIICKTIGQVMDAVNSATPGTTIYLRRGMYTFAYNLVIDTQGTADNYITIKGYPGEKVIISGAPVWFSGNCKYINFENVRIAEYTDLDWAAVLRINSGASYINLRNIEIYNISCQEIIGDDHSGCNGILLVGDSSTPITNINIENCYIHDCDTGWSEALTLNGHVKNCTIKNCTINNITNIGIDLAGNYEWTGTVGDSENQTNNCIVENCLIMNCQSPYATSAGLYSDGARDNIFRYNVIYNCQCGIELGSEQPGSVSENFTIHNNLIIDSGRSIGVGTYLETGAPNRNAYIYNNTFVCGDSNRENYGLYVERTDNVNFYNNIVYGTENTRMFNNYYNSNVNMGNNCWYQPSGQKPDEDSTGMFADPLFIDVADLTIKGSYHLSNSSPCINNGTNASSNYVGETDLNGNSRIYDSGTIDIGVFENQNLDVYVVIFKDWDGSELKVQTVTEGFSASAPPDPFRQGYIFAGWDIGFTNVTGNLTVTAQYNVIAYTVVFRDWNGSVLSIQSVDYDTSAIAPSEPVRDGYRFTGWDVDFSKITGDLTITAQYVQIIYYTVTFKDWNGAILKTETVEEGFSATAPANPSRNGYRFTGWDSSYLEVTSDLTITAQYIQIIYYTVTFVDWDGTVLSTQTIEENTAAKAPANPSRDGHIFTGWDNHFVKVTSNMTITAQYQEIIGNNVNNIYYGDTISGNLYLGDEGVIRIYIGDTLIYGIPK